MRGGGRGGRRLPRLDQPRSVSGALSLVVVLVSIVPALAAHARLKTPGGAARPFVEGTLGAALAGLMLLSCFRPWGRLSGESVRS
jgi:hypothetical protein